VSSQLVSVLVMDGAEFFVTADSKVAVFINSHTFTCFGPSAVRSPYISHVSPLQLEIKRHA
jgi:hypothetical protein